MPSPPYEDFERLPFMPGASPFHLKGLVYRRHVEYARQFVPGGDAAVNAQFRDPALRAFFAQPFLASSWYDALPIVPVWYATARVMGLPAVEFLRTRTRDQAIHDIHGVYRLLLKITSAETVALRMPRVVAQYFDFGTTEATLVRPGVVRVEHRGMPAVLGTWFAIVGEAYIRVALEIAGAAAVQFRRAPTSVTGQAHGVELVSLSAEVQYG
jgi:hypothetical protein